MGASETSAARTDCCEQTAKSRNGSDRAGALEQRRRHVESEARTTRYLGRAAYASTRRPEDRLGVPRVQRERERRPPRARCLPTENARFGRRVRREAHRHSPAREHRTAQTRSHARVQSSSAVAAFSSRPRWNGSRARVPHPGKGLNPYSHRNCWHRHDGDPGARRQAQKNGPGELFAYSGDWRPNP